MSRELLLARRLLDAVADPDASLGLAEEAANELALLYRRLDVPDGTALPVKTFNDMRLDDLSPSAWLYLLENRGPNDAEIPDAILTELYGAQTDPVFRTRLVGGGLAQAGSLKRGYKGPRAPRSLAELPRSWPRAFLQALENDAPIDLTAATAILTEFTLHLLQNGSDEALALVAAATAPDTSDWKVPARQTALEIVRRFDPDLTSIGRLFRFFES